MTIFWMRWFKPLLLCFALGPPGVLSHSYTSDNAPLTLVTEELHGFQEAENGRLTGGKIGTVMLDALERLDIKTQVQVLPWSRAYKMAQSRPNVLIFSLVRTPQREDAFIWIKHLLTLPTFAFAAEQSKLKNINTLEALKTHVISVKRHDVAHELLLQQGFVEGVNLAVAGTNQAALSMLLQGHVEIHPMSFFHLQNECKLLKCDPLRFQRLFEIPELRQEFYLASSKGTKSSTIQAFKQTLDTLLDSHHPPR